MSHRSRPGSRAMLRTALAVSVVGAALAAGAGAAAAAPTELPGSRDAVGGAATSLDTGIGPVKRIPIDPLAHTAVDPLTNAVRTQVADFRPIDTRLVTKPVTDGASLSQLPLVGHFSKLLPGG